MKITTIQKIDLLIENLCEGIGNSVDFEENIELTKALAQLITARALHD